MAAIMATFFAWLPTFISPSAFERRSVDGDMISILDSGNWPRLRHHHEYRKALGLVPRVNIAPPTYFVAYTAIPCRQMCLN